ncbi:concanavalin A-like lectin/glucanase [Exidia glandulosa HHB12029]|uniref:Concanavalin A-like lectin/glucanase n=1 Tax=Exidia glandulosa HHB12029 TaxID=1314781 RepID=A0A165M0V3_EXIGL|nr:concanavalin A-like lectin/glucanase [Exidia glandulosa HHB12029]
MSSTRNRPSRRNRNISSENDYFLGDDGDASSNSSGGHSGALRVPPPEYGPRATVRSTAVATSPLDDPIPGSYSSDSYAHTRPGPLAHKGHVDDHPLGADERQAYGGAHAHSGSVDQDSFFSPPAMPWMRNESSHGHDTPPASRPESPSYFGAPRGSNASPMPFHPHSSASSMHAPYGTESMYTTAPSRPKRAFVSHLLVGPIDKPWLKRRDPWLRASWWITVGLWFAGFAGTGVLLVFTYRDVPSVGKVCPAFTENFDGPDIDGKSWTHEISAGGFGTGGFEWTTDDKANSYIKNKQLYIMPTLTEQTSSKYSRDDILGTNRVNDPVPRCTSPGDSNNYFSDRPVGPAVGITKRETTYFERVKRFVIRSPQRRQLPQTPTTQGGGDDPDSNQAGGQDQGPTGGQGQPPIAGDDTPPDNQTPGVTPGTGDSTPPKSAGSTKDGGGANGVTGGGAGGGGAGLKGNHDPCNLISDLTTFNAVNPVQSARLVSTSSIKFGRVEVRAKMPTGDWLYPQISMLPKTKVYGNWPKSGQIDLALSRGNDANYPGGGRDFIASDLQWGPTVGFNAVDRTRGWYQRRRTNFNQAFHTFTLEWTDKFLWVFVDNRVQRVFKLDFRKQGFFERGDFPRTFRNGTDEAFTPDPWINSKSNAVPFDQEFYLVLTVQAGGTAGWFPDNLGKKPWFDQSAAAMWDFANNTDTWRKTWPEKDDQRAMIVDYVKFSKQC